MKLSSPAFKNNGKIPIKYTCQGLDINPPLVISDVPTGTKSFVLVMEDIDVSENIQRDRRWIHWLAYNIDPKIREIPEGTSEVGILGQNTGGKNLYMGPCPPDKSHRYFFRIYALNKLLELPEGISIEFLLHSIHGSILGQAETMGRYEKT
jgi:Raf kinase inhibitor-like YbhB/YbcL family protein